MLSGIVVLIIKLNDIDIRINKFLKKGILIKNISNIFTSFVFLEICYYSIKNNKKYFFIYKSKKIKKN